MCENSIYVILVRFKLPKNTSIRDIAMHALFPTGHGLLDVSPCIDGNCLEFCPWVLDPST